jgi:hypothetical protein
MKRKPKRQQRAQEFYIDTDPSPNENKDALPQELVRKESMPITENRILTPPGLQDIRSHMSNQRASTAQTIAELETWRGEIDATIAFLRGDKVA